MTKELVTILVVVACFAVGVLVRRWVVAKKADTPTIDPNVAGGPGPKPE